jgi:hypothetical protein
MIPAVSHNQTGLFFEENCMSFFEVAQKANDTVNGLVWGPPMLVLIVG